MQPPYTLDKWKDGAAQIRNEKEFQELRNYIPVDGGIVVRDGITTLTYTPQTTDVFDPKTDSRCYMVLDFEDGDELGRNVGLARTTTQIIYPSPMANANWTASSTWTLDCKEGTHALFLSNSTAENTACGSTPNSHWYGLARAADTVNMRDWVAGACAATSVDVWMVTGWFKQCAVKTSAYIFQTGIYGVSDGVHIGTFTGTGTGMWLRATWRNQGGAQIGQYNNVTGLLTLNRWYFFAAWCDDDAYSKGLYVYDDVLGTEYITAETGFTHFTAFYPTSSQHSIGGQRKVYAGGGGYATDDSEAFPGRIDYMTFWGELPTTDTDKLSLIRQIRDLHKA